MAINRKVRFFTEPYVIRLNDLGLVPNLPFATRAYNIDGVITKFGHNSSNQIIIIKNLWKYD